MISVDITDSLPADLRQAIDQGRLELLEFGTLALIQPDGERRFFHGPDHDDIRGQLIEGKAPLQRYGHARLKESANEPGAFEARLRIATGQATSGKKRA